MLAGSTEDRDHRKPYLRQVTGETRSSDNRACNCFSERWGQGGLVSYDEITIEARVGWGWGEPILLSLLFRG